MARTAHDKLLEKEMEKAEKAIINLLEAKGVEATINWEAFCSCPDCTGAEETAVIIRCKAPPKGRKVDRKRA